MSNCTRYAERADHKSAIEALRLATENPKDFSALVELAEFIFRTANYRCSAKSQRALDLNPYYVPAHLLLADSFVAMDKLKDAEASYIKAAELYQVQ